MISFDLENETIECTSWPRFDFLGYIDAPGKRTQNVVTLDQITNATFRLEELERERKRLAEEDKLAEQRSRLPLFADLLTI